ncbi:DUF4440 domain-containing protein [Streptomonospora sp. PA3]|uniref:DUF4440 domain-containing protein n=1 Tax=Streptomonospora sp. PA3 TaxID=2607326 RepID=UPI0016428240|nr:DUF4440 domain-containing protein [Streptomonospora sp. PA3]
MSTTSHPNGPGARTAAEAPGNAGADTGLDADLGAVRAEAERLHAVIERWFAGSSAAADADAELFARAQAPDFSFVGADGGTAERQAVLEAFAGARGRSPGLRIRIEDVRLVAADREVVVGSFLERHLDAPGARSRRCTAVFRRDPDTPHGLRWLHLQETHTRG